MADAEGVECIISSSTCLIAWLLHAKLDTLLVVDAPGLAEEGVECVASSFNGFVAWVKPVRLSTVLEA